MKTDTCTDGAALPGGALPVVDEQTATGNVSQRHEDSRPGASDRRLERTVMRSGRGGWYLISYDESGQAACRYGPIATIRQAEQALSAISEGVEPNAELDRYSTEAVHDVVQEGMRAHVYKLAEEWTRSVRENDPEGEASPDRPRKALVDYDSDASRRIIDGFNKLHQAFDGFQRWVES